MAIPVSRRPTRRPGVDVLFVPVLVIGAAVLAATPARAGDLVIEVTTTDDELNTDGDCSLREAIVASNTNAPVDACPAGDVGTDFIGLQPTEYVLTIPGRDEDAAATGDLDITEGARIMVADPIGAWATIDAAGIDRAFDVMDGASWWFQFVEIIGGDAADGDGGGIRVGDGVCVDGFPNALSGVESVTIRDNAARRGGGIHLGECWQPQARLLSIVGNTATAEGGGLSIAGASVLQLAVSTVSGNTAAVGGGMWIDLPDGDIHLGHVTVADNTGAEAAGIWLGNDATLEASIVADNHGPACGGPGSASLGLSDDDTCNGLITVDDVGLEALTQVGRHFVHPLGMNSVAIELAGEPFPEWCEPDTAVDQVGTAWPIDGNGDGIAMCDFGPVEAPAGSAQPPATPAPSASPGTLPDTALRPTSTPSWWGILLGLTLSGALAVGAASVRRRPGRRAG